MRLEVLTGEVASLGVHGVLTCGDGVVKGLVMCLCGVWNGDERGVCEREGV